MDRTNGSSVSTMSMAGEAGPAPRTGVKAPGFMEGWARPADDGDRAVLPGVNPLDRERWAWSGQECKGVTPLEHQGFRLVRAMVAQAALRGCTRQAIANHLRRSHDQVEAWLGSSKPDQMPATAFIHLLVDPSCLPRSVRVAALRALAEGVGCVVAEAATQGGRVVKGPRLSLAADACGVAEASGDLSGRARRAESLTSEEGERLSSREREEISRTCQQVMSLAAGLAERVKRA